MKQQKASKLSLNKVTITALDTARLSSAFGGATTNLYCTIPNLTYGFTCNLGTCFCMKTDTAQSACDCISTKCN